MTRFALSTMYAQHERFEDGAVFARFAADAGYDAIEISHSTPADRIGQIVAADVLPIVSVHQPAPWERSSLGIPNADLNLASLDRDERAEAIHYARKSIELAAELGAAAVVLHLGQVDDDELRDMDRRLRQRSGPEGFVPGALRRSAIARRSRLSEPYRDAARKSLRELTEVAAPLGVVLGVESRIHFHEIPLAAELPELLDGLDPERVGYWHDVGHVEVLHRLGYVDRSAWLGQSGVRCVGAHVHDVADLADHRAPGAGDVDWHDHLPYLAHLACWTLEINQFQPDDAVRSAPDLLRGALSRGSSRG